MPAGVIMITATGPVSVKRYIRPYKVDTAMQTVAQGSIGDSAEFLLSPEFAFTGDVSLSAAEKILTFDGDSPGHRLLHFNAEWVKFRSPVNPIMCRSRLTAPLKIPGMTDQPGTDVFQFRGQDQPVFFPEEDQLQRYHDDHRQWLDRIQHSHFRFRIARPES